MGLSPEKSPPDDELIRLMAEEPYLIRRPIIVAGGRLIIGFDKKRIDETLG
jgi:arsenate reductase-like glutaredoxin family protein